MSKYFVVVLVLVLALLGCDSGGDHEAPPPDPCIGGNIRSFTEDWTDIDHYALEKTAGHEYVWAECGLYQADVWWNDVLYENAVAFHHEVWNYDDFYEAILYAEVVDAHDADAFLLVRKLPFYPGDQTIPVTGWITVCGDVVTLDLESWMVYHDFEAVWVHTHYNEP